MRHTPKSDEAPIDQMFRRDLDALYRFAARLLRDREEAEDAVHDAYLRLSRADHDLSQVRHPRGWLFRVLRNACIDRLRADKVRMRVIATDVDVEELALQRGAGGTPEAGLIASDSLERVMRSMETLPPDLAEPLSLVVGEGLSYQEAATALGVPIGTLRSRLNRARTALREELADHRSKTKVEDWGKAPLRKGQR